MKNKILAILFALMVFSLPFTNADVKYNDAPIINGVGGPINLNVGEQGTWRVNAYDIHGSYLYYNVDWGEHIAYAQSGTNQQLSQEATFTHEYSNPGTYTITIKVTNSFGISAQTTINVNVGNITQISSDLAITNIEIIGNPVVGKETNFEVTIQNLGDGIANGYSLQFFYGEDAGNGIGTSGIIQPGQVVKHVTSYVYVNPGEYTFKAEVNTNNDNNPENNVMKKTFYVKKLQLNQAPVITSISGPTNLNVGEQGTWKINAYDPDGNYLYYHVDWGEKINYPLASNSQKNEKLKQEATFTNSYNNLGVYTITITVIDEQGLNAQSSINVNVEDVIGEFGGQVKCIFDGSKENQKCYTSDGRFSCSGIQSCVTEVHGKQNEKLTWESTCGGYAYTVVNGQNQYAEFKCSSTSPDPNPDPNPNPDQDIKIKMLKSLFKQLQSVISEIIKLLDNW